MIKLVCTACYSPLKFILYPLVLCCVWLFGWLRHVMMCMYAYFIHLLWCVCIISLPLVLLSVSGNTLSTHYCNCKKIANCSLFTDGALRNSVLETCPCAPYRIGIWRFWFKERGKLEYLEKNLSEERREPTTNSTHIWRQRQDSNPGHTGGDECSHHSATLPSRVFSWVWMLHYTFTCYDLYALLLNELLTLSMVFSVAMNVDFHNFSSALVSLLFAVNL